jgi:hypothetical protein
MKVYDDADAVREAGRPKRDRDRDPSSRIIGIMMARDLKFARSYIAEKRSEK